MMLRVVPEMGPPKTDRTDSPLQNVGQEMGSTANVVALCSRSFWAVLSVWLNKVPVSLRPYLPTARLLLSQVAS